MNPLWKEKIKKIALRLPVFTGAATYLTHDLPRIFVYHRFSQFGSPSTVSAASFSWQLDQLVGHNWHVISLAQYIAACHEGTTPDKVVVLTIDDGYRDFYEIAYPELRRRNMAATFFVTTDFVDKKIWLWPDRVRYILDHGRCAAARFPLGDTLLPLTITTTQDKESLWQQIVHYCITVSDAERNDVLCRLERQCQVMVPEVPSEAFAAVSWEQLREMAANGIEIGCHTKSHPILSRVAPGSLATEIGAAKQILEERLAQPIETFCYPNSGPGDITEEVVEVVKRFGYKGAVFGTIPDYTDPYLLPRLGGSNDQDDFLWKLNGIESLLLRRRFSGRAQDNA